MMDVEPYHADPSLGGKLRRRLVRLRHRRPAAARLSRPMISFTFDDAPASAFAAGAQALESRGARASYFVCAGTVGQEGAVGRLGRPEDMQRVQAAGHEIGCHTFSHLDCARADVAAIEAELERNLERFEAWGLGRPQTFAYPYGEVAAPAKRLVGGRFAVSRCVQAGLIRQGGDLAQAPAVGLEGEDGEAKAAHWMDRAAENAAWLILFTHGVGDAVTRYGCTRAALERLADRALSRGFEIVTVAQGAQRMAAA